MIPTTSARPNNDYTQADLDAEASEEELPEPTVNWWRAWPLIGATLIAIAVPAAVALWVAG